MKKTIITTTILAAAITATSAATTFQTAGGDLLDTGNWSNGLPTGSKVGKVSSDSTWDTSDLPGWHLILNGGNATAVTDLGPSKNGSFTMNGGTLRVGDDILANDITYTFNGGTVSWGDRFEPNGVGDTGLLSINAGTFKGGGKLSRLGSSLAGATNILGGTFTNTSLIFTSHGVTSSIGGSATITTVGGNDDINDVNFLSNWTGSITSATFTDLASWKTELTGGSNYFNATVLDSATFDAHFKFENGALQVGPEPPAAVLIGFSKFALILRRHK